jgi:ABC-2 type transport system permease protein
LQVGFYATPIIYPMSLAASFSPTMAKIVLLNPVAMIIQDARSHLITNTTITTFGYVGNAYLVIIPFAIILIIAVLAVLYFRKRSKYFAEDI